MENLSYWYLDNVFNKAQCKRLVTYIKKNHDGVESKKDKPKDLQGNVINNTNYFEYLFIGDSFTEGVGLKFNETFVGIFKDNSNSSVANLGVQSYSPIIYF